MKAKQTISDFNATLALGQNFEKLTSEELYKIIKVLCGHPIDRKIIEKEKIYVCSTKPAGSIKFLFIRTTPILLTDQLEPTTSIFVGKFDNNFEDIEIYGVSDIPSSIFSATQDYLGVLTISELMKDEDKPVFTKPIKFIDVLQNIVFTPGFRERDANDIFSLKSTDKVPALLKETMNLYVHYDRDRLEYKDFSGIYFLLASCYREWLEPGTRIHTYVKKSGKTSGNAKITFGNYLIKK